MIQLCYILFVYAWHLGVLDGVNQGITAFRRATAFDDLPFGPRFIVLFIVILPAQIYAWTVLSMALCVPMKWLLFPLGMKAACTYNAQEKRWEANVYGCTYLRWWMLDHTIRNIKPFVYGALLRRSALATWWYRALGMNVNPRTTLIISEVDDVGEFDFWKVDGAGTVFHLRSYGFGWSRMAGQRVLYFIEREETRNDVNYESEGRVHVLLVWLSLVPSTLALGVAEALAIEGMPGGVAPSPGSALAFGYYSIAMSAFLILAPIFHALCRGVLEVFTGPTEMGNLILEAIEIIPACVSFSYLNTLWLRMAGVGVATNNLFCGARTPRNPSLVTIEDNVFLSNCTITGPVLIEQDAFAGLRARLRPGSIVHARAGIAAHSTVPLRTEVGAGKVVLKNWKVSIARSMQRNQQRFTGVQQRFRLRQRNFSQKTKQPMSEGRSSVCTCSTHPSSMPEGTACTCATAAGETVTAGARAVGDLPGAAAEPSSLLPDDSARTYIRTIDLQRGSRGAVKSRHFDSIASHVPYVMSRLLHLVLIVGVLAANMVLWNYLCGTPFFDFREGGDLGKMAGNDAMGIGSSAIEFVGFVSFFTTFSLIELPLLMVIVKWLTLGRCQTVHWVCLRTAASLVSPRHSRSRSTGPTTTAMGRDVRP
eukprot:CAMPEP_0115830344 /NCGR_PEP_ID=MMETSP0287-20121206/1570_1 /TAXON_ID=412157 /ORGANISM="Chrysochromulina rotalis, Strain UIO044" /LENGTH=648 /DNA_ID=CAMNT_0003283647 /DNA_START=114 /DNA_END=2060 /DNA_ORIENTATION=-